jgi:methionyl-tRNA formyltransferase
MILNDVGIVLADSARSRAYLQNLCRCGLYPARALMLEDTHRHTPDVVTADVLARLQSMRALDTYFDITIPAKTTLEKFNIPHTIVLSKDINTDVVIQEITAMKQKYVIFSGSAAMILKKNALDIGKKFIHLHSGKVPEYRGSTTLYYSILNNGVCHVSAFFLDQNIDTGPLIKIKKYPKPDNGELIDFIYDAHIRSDLLVEILQDYVKRGAFEVYTQPKKNEEVYFIIHPVLKHIAILSCRNNEK